MSGQQPRACVGSADNALALRYHISNSHGRAPVKIIVQTVKNFAELDQLLKHLGAPVSAPECHGFISAQLCMDNAADVKSWREYLGVEGDEPEATLARISQATSQELESNDFSFEPILPPEEATLALRTDALAQWCRGFLLGLGSSGLTETGLTGECREIVEDMERISRVHVEQESGEDFALMELIEFVRVGTLSIYHELRPMRAASQSQQSSLH